MSVVIVKIYWPINIINRDDVLGWWKGDLTSDKDNLLAFKNPDNSIVIVVYNKGDKEKF